MWMCSAGRPPWNCLAAIRGSRTSPAARSQGGRWRPRSTSSRRGTWEGTSGMKPDRPDPLSPLCPLSRLGPLCPLRRQPTNGPNGQNGPNRLNGLNGQAMIELAIFGSFAILALGFLIQIGLRQNFQQEIEQTAFRRALIFAKSEGDEESQSVQYSYFRNRRAPNPSDGFAVTPRSLTQGSSTLTLRE